MTEALRVRKRKWLQQAKWIFLGFDDKRVRKLLRSKCDTPNLPTGLADAESSRTCFEAVQDSVAGDPCWQQYGARIGVVGGMPVAFTSATTRSAPARTRQIVVTSLHLERRNLGRAAV